MEQLMDIGKSFTYMFDDDRWGIKLIILAGVIFLGMIGSVILIGPFIMGAFVLGYMVEIMRRVRAGEEHPLPEWDRWGEKFVDGLKLLIAIMIWALPIWVLTLPMSLMGAVAGDDGGGPLGLVIMCLSCIVVLYSVFLALVTPAIYVSYSEKGTFGSALDFSRVTTITREHLVEVIIILIVLLIAAFLAGVIGLLLCVVGLLFTLAYVYMVEGHMFGQLAAAAGPTVPLRGPTEPDAPTGWDSEPTRTDPGDPTVAEPADPDEVVADVQRRSQEALDDMDDATTPPSDPAPTG